VSAPDVAILGAGIMGASVGWHLMRRGVKDVLLLDRSGSPGQGSTGRATGGFRAQYATSINVRLSLLSRAKLLSFAEDTGVPPGYAPCGYLWLAGSPRDMAALEGARRVQHEAGLREAVSVDTDEIRTLNPALALDGVVGGAWCPTDGFVRPCDMLAGYLRDAERQGARVRWGAEVTALECRTDRVVAVRLGNERIPCGVVVNALGAWAAAVMNQTGFDLPVTPLRRQVAATVPTDALPAAMPMTIFAEDGFHLRVRDGRVLLLWPTPGVAGNPFDGGVDDEWVRQVTAKARSRVPALRQVPVDAPACWGGLYEMSPDKHAILGPAPGVPNLYLINGSSGHGVMHAPALGHLLAEIVCDGSASTLDVHALRPGRFVEQDLNPVSELL
jgi:sarcosine oxidase subunit beta